MTMTLSSLPFWRTALFMGATAVSVSIAFAAAARGDTSADDLAACQRATDPLLKIALCSKVADNSSEIEDIRAEALLNRGFAHAAAGRDADAIADFTRAIAINPEYGAIYVNRGASYARAGEMDKAIVDFTTALAIESADGAALRSRGALYLKQRRFDRALADFDALVALDPGDADAYVARAIAYEHSGDAKLAEQDYRTALSLDVDNEMARDGLARLSGAF